jgi:hypothetical protein
MGEEPTTDRVKALARTNRPHGVRVIVCACLQDVCITSAPPSSRLGIVRGNQPLKCACSAFTLHLHGLVTVTLRWLH